jgi:glycosyltransferase involved in cell wall biosynthesis
MHTNQRLTIISDTAMFQNATGLYAFGPVVRELEFLAPLFDEITWVGFERTDKEGDLSMKKIKSNKIKIVLLKNVGGSGFFWFFKILLQYPKMFFVIVKNVQKANIIHTRAPSHPALIAILISVFMRKNKIWWNKYAGDWGQLNPSLAYKFQREILKLMTYSKVTINGFWPNQQKHCFSFENPCLTMNDIEVGKQIAKEKVFLPPYTFAFVGRFDDVKGVSILLKALKGIPIEMIDKIHLIGDGPKTPVYKEEAKELGSKAIFHGQLEKSKLHKLISESHFFLLPSKAEGFPKVVAEAACYGVIPIVSNVGSIEHYINKTNGFVWDNKNHAVNYSSVFNRALQSDQIILQSQSKEILTVAEKFTFDNYLKKLKLHILISNEKN